MRLILDERELPSIRKILMALVMRHHSKSSYLFSRREYREWAYGIVDEAIGVALESDDWNPGLRSETKVEANPHGLEIWFIFLKTLPIAQKELRRERRYKRALQATVVREETPDYRTAEDRTLENLDLERALPLLSPDQGAAISLLHFSHMTIEEAAKVMKRSRSAMDMLLSRARKKLSEILENPFIFDAYADPVVPPPKSKPGRPRKEQDLKRQDDFHRDRRRQNES